MSNNTNSYFLYQQYETRNGQTIPAYPNIFSVDGDGTMPLSAKTYNDVACGYTGGTTSNYFAFVATDNCTFKFSGNSINYSVDNGSTWTSLASNTSSPTVNPGNKIMWKATITPNSTYGIGRFSSTGRFVVTGNFMSLLYGDNFDGKVVLSANSAGYGLFSGCTGITSADSMELPATSLTENAYEKMFKDCTNLTTPPRSLPSTNLTGASGCYTEMFMGCTSLTKTPTLPATTIVNNCYDNMFCGCTSLVTAPSILPATTLANTCYPAMFCNCTSLTRAPELPASNLTMYAYYKMFSGCTSLNYIKCYATNISANSCTKNWVSGVQTTSGTFIKSTNMSSWTTGVNGIPSGWTVQSQ